MGWPGKAPWARCRACMESNTSWVVWAEERARGDNTPGGPHRHRVSEGLQAADGHLRLANAQQEGKHTAGRLGSRHAKAANGTKVINMTGHAGRRC